MQNADEQQTPLPKGSIVVAVIALAVLAEAVALAAWILSMIF